MAAATAFLNTYFLGARIWVWLYFAFIIIVLVLVALYFKREALKGVYYRMRWKERVIKVVIHYTSSIYKIYWRLIPDESVVKVDKKMYLYDERSILHNKESYMSKPGHGAKDFLIVSDYAVVDTDKKGRQTIKIEGEKEYVLTDIGRIKDKSSQYPEIHYFYNKPEPILWDIAGQKQEFSSLSLKEFKENDLFGKLLRMKMERSLLMFLLILGIMNLVMTLFLIAKVMGWLK